jgi:hypothetical protein
VAASQFAISPIRRFANAAGTVSDMTPAGRKSQSAGRTSSIHIGPASSKSVQRGAVLVFLFHHQSARRPSPSAHVTLHRCGSVGSGPAQAWLSFGSGLLRYAQVLAHPAHSPRRSPIPPHQKLSGFSDGAQNPSPPGPRNRTVYGFAASGTQAPFQGGLSSGLVLVVGVERAIL